MKHRERISCRGLGSFYVVDIFDFHFSRYMHMKLADGVQFAVELTNRTSHNSYISLQPTQKITVSFFCTPRTVILGCLQTGVYSVCANWRMKLVQIWSKLGSTIWLLSRHKKPYTLPQNVITYVGLSSHNHKNIQLVSSRHQKFYYVMIWVLFALFIPLPPYVAQVYTTW
jgi:hypothetical protein